MMNSTLVLVTANAVPNDEKRRKMQKRGKISLYDGSKQGCRQQTTRFWDAGTNDAPKMGQNS